VTGYLYDALNRTRQVGYGSASTLAPAYTSTITYTYDAANRLTLASDSANGNISRQYDNRFDTISQETTSQGTVNYTYYADGQRASVSPSGGSTVSYFYDTAGRLQRLEQAAGTGTALPSTKQSVVVTSYDTANRLTGLTLPNGITVKYSYDAASQLKTVTYKKSDGTLLGDLGYSYNKAGLRQASSGSLARTTLPTAVASRTYDVNNKLTHNGVAQSYDNNGNLLNDGSRTYTWNVRNQLTGITSTTENASYSYDALGRRRSATLNGQTTTTLYDGWNPIQLQAGGVAVENRLYGLGLDSIFARTRAGVTETYIQDALGSTVELRNAAQAQTVQYTYDPYGVTTASVASTNTLKYTGREQDFNDLYYYRNRYYKPSIGRFITEDPIGLAGGSNLYGYVEGNPTNFIDPEGLTRCWSTGQRIVCDYGQRLPPPWADPADGLFSPLPFSGMISPCELKCNATYAWVCLIVGPIEGGSPAGSLICSIARSKACAKKCESEENCSTEKTK
jgi:RHS repeat-associated protein